MDLDDKSPEEIFDMIRQACEVLGWDIAMDSTSPGIVGAVVGVREYIDSIVTQLNDEDNYEIWTKTTENAEMH